ncbi:ankyrin repeat domain-containing protein [Plakobranchus ocellatus]|uniref:Ankyrin repeat domain-containing protein n=1 Tax=Plakobranchus ocellatus TaxID=259542 RepID=A0AAV4A1R0_9GAST|nr:ankyrin repeat domain-containing protein [Plakobranchus ocellatus]
MAEIIGEPGQKLIPALENEDLYEVDRLLSQSEQSMSNQISYDARNEALQVACRAGQEFYVHKMISAGAGVDTRTSFGDFPLMIAVEEGNANMVRLLLDSGAHAQQENLAGETALKVALYRDHFECAKILLDKYKPAGKNLARLARGLVEAGHTEAFKLMASHCNDQVSSQILLVPAVMSGDTEIVQSLLDRGADLNIPYLSGDTALIAAVKYLSEPHLMNMVIFLVKNGAQVKGSVYKYSPLAACALFDKPSVINYLVNSGADVNKVGDGDCITPSAADIECLKNSYESHLSYFLPLNFA